MLNEQADIVVRAHRLSARPAVKPLARANEGVRFVAIGLLFFCLAAGLQWLGGAYSSELSGDPDEPAHYVTGLMVHDYLSTWPPPSPAKFAEDFYLHYPKMSLGHWPPFFYLLQAAWMLLFSSSYTSVLVLMAFLTALLGASVYRAIRVEHGALAGAASGILLIIVPLVQQFSAMVMTEIPVALLCFWAALRFGRFLQTEHWKDSAWFGVLASLAIMTKGSGLALALVPGLAMLFARRLDLLRRRAFWLPAAIVAVLCGPWYLMTLHMARNGWSGELPDHFVLRAFPYNSWELIKLLGGAVFVVAAIGFWTKVVRPMRDRRTEGKWAAMGALVVSVWLFQSLVPASLDARHLITAAAPMVLFLAAGVAWLAWRLPAFGISVRGRAVVLAALVALVFGASTFAIAKKIHRGFDRLAQDLLAGPEFRHSVFLISSQHDGEGIFIAEVAMREHRPGHLILRASKVLAESEWTGKGYRLLYPDPAQAMLFLENVPVGVLILDMTPGTKDHPHHRELLELIRRYPDRWQLVGTYPKDGRRHVPGEQVLVYRMMGGPTNPTRKVRIDLRPMLDRVIER